MIKNNQFLKKYGACIVAAIVFFILAYAYCFPVLKGKVLYAPDGVNAACAVHEGVEYTEATGDHSWWTGSMFCGMPNYQIGGGQYKSSLLLKPFDAVLHRGHGHTAWVLIIYFFCFFALLRSFDVDKWLAIVGAVAIALSSYFLVIIAAGHGGKTSTIALMSVVFAGFHLIFKKKYGIGAIFVMLFTSIGFSTHPQMAYYICMLIGVCWFAELYTHIKERRTKDLAIATLIFAGTFALGLGTGCSNIFVNSEYTSQTMRGGHSELVKNDDAANRTKGLDLDYATAWSYGIDETFSLLIPGFKGGASSVDLGRDSELYRTMVRNGVPSKAAADFCKGVPMYWGEQPFTAGNVYCGAIVCFLFVLGLLIVGGPYKWALLIATLFSIFLAWGHNWMGLTRLFFDWFPLYNKFRAVSSILIVAEITMPLLGFMALKKIMDGEVSGPKALRSIAASAGITGGICLIFALLGGTIYDFTSSYDEAFASRIPDWLYGAILDERCSLLRGDSLRSLIFIALSAGVIALFACGRLKKGWMTAALGVLVLLDMWPVDKRYFNDSNFISGYQADKVLAMQPWEEEILRDKTPHFRVFNAATNTFNDARTSYRLKSIGGYHAAKLRRYQDMIDNYLSQGDTAVVNMLNARYVIVPGNDGQSVPVLNPDAFGNAWYVESLRTVANANDEIDALGRINLRREAVLDSSFAGYVSDFNPGIAPDASVSLTNYTPKSIDYVCSSSGAGTIVFSEIYYPYGWKASLDGVPADHFRVNYTLRAMNVPEGEHSIRFEFDPDSVKKGDMISVIMICLMYLISAVIIFCYIRKIFQL